MGSWVAMVLVALGSGSALETRYFDSRSDCEAWAGRITTPPAALRPDATHQVAACFHVRELIAQLAQGR